MIAPLSIALSHQKEARRLTEAREMERRCAAQIMVGRHVQELNKSRPRTYKVTEVVIAPTGAMLLYGHYINQRRRRLIGDLHSVSIVAIEKINARYYVSAAKEAAE